MTVFEKIKSMNVDEFVEWYDKYCTHDDDLCINWWNNNYCGKCKPEIGRYEDSDRDIEFCWCELYSKCKYFQDLNEVPDTLHMTRLWLESEYEDK